VMVSTLSIPFFTCTACQRLVDSGLEVPSNYCLSCSMQAVLVSHGAHTAADLYLSAAPVCLAWWNAVYGRAEGNTASDLFGSLIISDTAVIS